MYDGAEGFGGDSGASIELIGPEAGGWDTHRADWVGGGRLGHP